MKTQAARPITVIAEHDQGNIRPVTYELLAFARELGPLASNRITAIILGDDIVETADRLARETGVDVLAVRSAQLRRYSAEVYKHVLQEVLLDIRPGIVCIAHSAQGSDFAPGLSVRLDAVSVTQAEKVAVADGELTVSRRIYGGKIQADVHAGKMPLIVTFQPGAIAPLKTPVGPPGRIAFRKVTVPDQEISTLSSKAVPTGQIQLDDARTVVTVGRGVEDETQLAAIYELAALIPHAVVCGSRPVVDMGWLPHERQIGISGATISPSLYLACGVSGAQQHIAGIRGADFIVSINRDPTAAIFQISDICIVEDLRTFIPVLISELQRRGKAKKIHE